MKKEYDFDKMKGKKNPFANSVKKSVFMNLDTKVLDYFKAMSKQKGIPYQNLINAYLLDCVEKKVQLTFKVGS